MSPAPIKLRSRSLWNRLLYSISGIVVIVWLVLAVSLFFFRQVQNNYSELAMHHIPDMAVASELADLSVRLSVVSTQIAAQSDDTAGTSSKEELEQIVGDLLESLKAIETNPRAQAVIGLIKQVQTQLQTVSDLQSLSRGEEREISEQMKSLRWLNADVQSEIEPLMSDFAFNIKVATSSLVSSSDREFRARQAELIEAERREHDAIRRLGDATANAVTLMFQAAFAADLKQLSQLRGLADDALDGVAPLQGLLPHEPQLATLKQSIEALLAAANNSDNIFTRRESWINAHRETLEQLGILQASLSSLQVDLAQLGETQRQNILQGTQNSLSELEIAIRWLVGLTILTAVIAVLVLYRYVRRGIIQPLRTMTGTLADISQSQNLALKATAKGDEIRQLSHAIAEFKRSIETRDAALSSLEEEVKERARAVEILKVTQKELIQAGKMAALGQMAAGIAHELNQPLAAMQHRLHLLSVDGASADTQLVDRQVGRLTGLVDRMGRTIKYLRNFARRAEFKNEPLRLSELIDDAILIIRTRLQEAGIEVRKGDHLDRICVEGDKILIEQVLVNVLSNAIDATLTEEEAGRIEIDAEEIGDSVHIRISDNGGGLGELSPMDALDPFVTTKEVGKGLGLGLSISYNIMKDLQGDLWLEPRQDAPGTNAFLTLQRGTLE